MNVKRKKKLFFTTTDQMYFMNKKDSSMKFQFKYTYKRRKNTLLNSKQMNQLPTSKVL